ncbi:hypothetical protein [Bradyrhizobium prioriisuperbiae]|uniref:hypothetical protein n=1 Tax=Bradyrhizobium prioriisuperbiae TaxID=2854389 RepID=UPI0028E5C2BF|nr:hypothetical protein [Bradyrhizobium prioritasuperba]
MNGAAQAEQAARRRSLRSAPLHRRTYFEPLMRVSFRHAYYNRFDDACPDFDVHPTAFTQHLMSSLGLVFKDEGTGFAVFYDKNRKDDLESYLRRQGTAEPGMPEQFWTRLSFVLASRSPYFLNVTDVPIDINPTQQNFYFTNEAAHLEPEVGVILNPNQAVGATQLLPVIPQQYPAPVSDDIAGITVRAISGEVVLCEPRCIPDQATPYQPSAGCSHWLASLPPTLPNRCRDVIYLDFSLLPEDKYTIEYMANDGHVDRTETCLYTADAPTPLCLIDLMFSRPSAETPGIYPVQNLTPKGETTMIGVDYVLNFDARSTFWTYFIVPQPSRVTFDDLFIESLPPGPSASFAGPLPVVLANGAPAYQFVSEQPLLLQQQSPYRLRLKGKRSDRRLDDDTLIDRLPVAANQQVLPQASATASQPTRRPRSRVKSIQRSTTPSYADANAGTRNYSDIYVYV